MKEYSEIKQIDQHKKQARQFHPNAVVVPVEKAKSAIERAYQKGLSDGMDIISKVKKNGKS